MKTSVKSLVAISVFCFVVLPGAGFGAWEAVSPELEGEVRNLARTYDTHYRNKDFDALMTLVDPDYFQPFLGMNKDGLRKAMEKRMEELEFIEVKSTVTEIRPLESLILLRISRVEQFRMPDGKEENLNLNLVRLLSRRDGALLIKGAAHDIDPKNFDAATGVYSSSVGKYSIEIPKGWLPLDMTSSLMGMTPEAIAALSPDGRSCALLGFVQLPLRLTPKQGLEADLAMEKTAAAKDHVVFEQGDTKVGELEGYQAITGMTTEGTARKRLRAYFGQDPMLYFFICDAIPPARFDTLRPEFDAIIQSFKILPSEEGLSHADAVVAESAQGAVSGRTYTSRDFNCFIAAPEGWEIRTSANPAHLVEMQYKSGKSIARLIAAKEIPPDVTAQAACDGRLKSVAQLVQDFIEVSRGEVVIQEQPAVESVQTFSVEGLGKFHVKEVTVVRDGVYYLILCQCIEPDKYEILEPDFDKIIQSFGFIQ